MKKRSLGALLLSLALMLSILPPAAEAVTVVDITQEITLRVGETVQLYNPASNEDMALFAYSWTVKNREVVSESHVTNGTVATVTALQPGRAIVTGHLNGCYTVTKQVSSNYNSSTNTWDRFRYTGLSDNYSYTYRFYVTVLNADGSQPGGKSFADLEAEIQAATEEALRTGSGSCGANVSWNLENGTLTISGSGRMTNYTQYQLQPWSIYDEYIERVIVQDGVTNVGSHAFANYDNLKSISLAGSVKEIGEQAFVNCDALESVVMTDGLTKIGDRAFYNCKALETVLLPNTVTDIGAYTFSCCASLTLAALPTSLKTIGKYAFESCHSLESIAIPASVTSLGQGAFSHSDNLEEIVMLGKVRTLDDWTFSFDPSLRTVYLSDSVKSIDWSAFSNSDNITDIYYGGTESAWRYAAYDSLFYTWNVPSRAKVHYNSDMPDPPAVENTSADVDALAQAAAGNTSTQPSQSTQPAGTGAGQGPTDVLAYESFQEAILDGYGILLNAYALKDQNGNLTNYVRLRDMAQLLSNTDSFFYVGWDASVGIYLIQGMSYSGSEEAPPFTGTRAGVLDTQIVLVNGEPVSLETLTLTDDSGGGYSYVKLRDLGQALNFNVRWDGIVFIESYRPYTG